MRRRDFNNQEPDNYSGLTGYDEMSSRRVDATVGADAFSTVTAPAAQNFSSAQSAPLFTPPPQSGSVQSGLGQSGSAIDRLFDGAQNANNGYAQQSFFQNNAGGQSFGSPQQPQYSQNNGYAQNAAPNGGYAQNSAYGSGERPMVFSIERDPNGYIYEYSDRLEYYRYTGAGMVLINSVKKR